MDRPAAPRRKADNPLVRGAENPQSVRDPPGRARGRLAMRDVAPPSPFARSAIDRTAASSATRRSRSRCRPRARAPEPALVLLENLLREQSHGRMLSTMRERGSRLSRPPRRPDRWPSGAARRPVGGGPGISLKCSVFCADTEFEAHRRELPNSMCPTRSCALFAFTLG